MSPIAQLRAELTELAHRIESSRILSTTGEVCMAHRYIELANELVGTALARELEQSQQPAQEVRP